MKPYCTQNNGNCKTCSLVNYNRDCRNNPLHGGYRPGSGAPKQAPPDAKRRTFLLTDAEHVKVREHIEYIRRKALKEVVKMKFIANLKDESGNIRTGYEDTLIGTREEAITDYLYHVRINLGMEEITEKDIDLQPVDWE